MIASEKAISEKLNNLDAAKSGSMEDIIQDAPKRAGGTMGTTTSSRSRTNVEEVNLDQLAASSEEAPVIKLANLILVQAIKDRASDIHIEPFEKTVRLRYRIDGVLIDATPPPKQMQLAAGLPLQNHEQPGHRRAPPAAGRPHARARRRQGLRFARFHHAHRARRKNRAARARQVQPLRQHRQTRPGPGHLPAVQAAVDAPHGLMLVTGPTGSGKTTTLYSALNELNSPIYNIVTVEDPVEFQIPGINQVPVKKEIGLTFANALRSILRQDPDIIMIGEIRDTETAEIAIEAALTGHQVLSTMHCNDAPGAIARLDDMGIAPFLISSSVILSCAQRLMRRICPHCKEPVTYPGQNVPGPEHRPSIFDGTTLYRGRGCDRCKNSGYAGRWPSSKP
jgi:type IV pilus assembly protein PilB